MKINHLPSLSRKEQEDIRRIVRQCRESDGLTLSCPEDGDEYWLLEQDGITVSFMAVYKTEETTWECCPFTRPDCRRKGYFSALLEQVCGYSETHGEPDLCFVTDHRCPAALAALEELGAELCGEEYMMEYDLTAVNESRYKEILPPSGWGKELILCIAPEENASKACAAKDVLKGENTSLTVSAANPGGSAGPDSCPDPCVTCRLTLNGGSVYLYSLQTEPKLRRQGLASVFLDRLIALLADAGRERLCLQVSGSNEPALNLYKKTGFHITETLSYYLY